MDKFSFKKFARGTAHTIEDMGEVISNAVDRAVKIVRPPKLNRAERRAEAKKSRRHPYHGVPWYQIVRDLNKPRSKRRL